jgi:hypothetical protein
VQLHPVAAVTFGCPMSTRVIHENLSHDVRGDTDEISPAADVSGRLTDKAQVRLIHQRGALQRVALALTPQVVSSDSMQLVIDQRYKRVERRGISGFPLSQKHRDRLGKLRRHFDLSDKKSILLSPKNVSAALRNVKLVSGPPERYRDA